MAPKALTRVTDPSPKHLPRRCTCWPSMRNEEHRPSAYGSIVTRVPAGELRGAIAGAAGGTRRTLCLPSAVRAGCARCLDVAMQSKMSLDMLRPVRGARAGALRPKGCRPSSSASVSRTWRAVRAEPDQSETRVKSSAERTMAGLDALLGIDEEEEKRKLVCFGQSRAAAARSPCVVPCSGTCA